MDKIPNSIKNKGFRLCFKGYFDLEIEEKTTAG